MDTVKDMTEENIRILEYRIDELKKLQHNIELGLVNLQETLDKDKAYLESLK